MKFYTSCWKIYEVITIISFLQSQYGETSSDKLPAKGVIKNNPEINAWKSHEKWMSRWWQNARQAVLWTDTHRHVDLDNLRLLTVWELSCPIQPSLGLKHESPSTHILRGSLLRGEGALDSHSLLSHSNNQPSLSPLQGLGWLIHLHGCGVLLLLWFHRTLFLCCMFADLLICCFESQALFFLSKVSNSTGWKGHKP